MDSLKFLIRFSLKFLGAYIGLLLLFSFSGGTELIRDIYGNMGQSIFQNWSNVAEIHAKPNKEDKNNDLVFQIVDRQKLAKLQAELRQKGGEQQDIQVLSFNTNSRTTVLMPLIFFLSLIIAYPSNIRHKILSFFLGLLPLLFYIFFKLGCMLFYSIDTNPEFFPDYEFSAFTNKFLFVVDSLFIEAAYIVAIVIWVVVCVRKEDLKSILP